MVWFDRNGRRQTTAAPIGHYSTLCLSSDGATIVYELADPISASVDLYAIESAGGGVAERLTFEPAMDFYPVCSPEGDEAAFASARRGRPNPFRLSTRLPGSERQLLEHPTVAVPTDWSRDGLLVLSIFSPQNKFDVAVVPIDGDDPTPVVAGPADERNGQLSPDGQWLAYVSNETGRFEVFVQPRRPARDGRSRAPAAFSLCVATTTGSSTT